MTEELRTKDPLLPCPWCGGDNLETFLTREAVGVIEYVQCMDCTSCGPDHKEGRHWNKRPGKHDVLCAFYNVESMDALVEIQSRHVERLQAKLPTSEPNYSGRSPREG
jgi:hypothetical protein